MTVHIIGSPFYADRLPTVCDYSLQAQTWFEEFALEELFILPSVNFRNLLVGIVLFSDFSTDISVANGRQSLPSRLRRRHY